MVDATNELIKGTVEGTVVDVEAGQQIFLDATGDDRVVFVRDGDNLVVTWVADGTKVVLQGFFVPSTITDLPPQLTLADGSVISITASTAPGEVFSLRPVTSSGGGAAYQSPSDEVIPPIESVAVANQTQAAGITDITETLPNTVQVTVTRDEEVDELVDDGTKTTILADDTLTTDEDTDLDGANISDNTSSDYLPNGPATVYETPGDVTLTLPSGTITGVYSGWVVDGGNPALWTTTLTGYGKLTFDALGPEAVTVSFDIDTTGTAVDGDSGFDVLNGGAQARIEFNYETSASPLTITDDATVTIYVTGTNDAPEVTSSLSASATEAGSTVDLDLLSLASDIDRGDSLSLSGMSALPSGLSLSGTTLTIDPTDAAFDSLAVGDTTQLVVTYNIDDTHGGSVAQTATITITGTNDAPAVSAALTAGATEGGSSVNLDLLSLASDADTGDSLSLSGMSTLPSGLSLSGTTLTIDPTDTSFNSLAAGETTQIVVTYNIDDTNGGSVAQTATIIITGSNDAPAVSSALTADATQGGGTISVELLTFASDDDTNDTLSLSGMTALPSGVTLTGTVLTVDPTDASFSGLTAGQTTQVVVTFNVVDGQGGSVAQTATITVTGNSDPVAVADTIYTVATSFTIDDFALTFNDTDADGGDVLFISAASPVTGGYTVTDGTDVVTVSGITGDGSFSYQTDDGNGGQHTGTVAVTYVNSNTLTGNSTNNVVIGGTGNDTLSGVSGDDTLYGGDGDDSLRGGNGVDVFFGGAGSDIIEGGSRSDFVNYSDNAAAVVVDLDAGTGIENGSDTDTLTDIENIIGSDFDDTLTGGSADNVNNLQGGLGDDLLTGDADADTFTYTSISDGDDTITDFDVTESDVIDLDLLFDALGITGESREDDVILTDTGSDTVLTIDGQAGFSITLTSVDLDVTDEATLRAQFTVGDES